MEEKKKDKTLYKKWWFWTIILTIVIVIAFTTIMSVALIKVTTGVSGLAMQIQDIYKDSTVYTSAGDNVLLLELNNWDNQYSNKLKEIIKLIKETVENGELNEYSKFITISYIKSNDKNNVLCIKETYSIPDFVKEEEKEYIAFEEYQNLYNTLDKTMNGYTNLFNSIY